MSTKKGSETNQAIGAPALEERLDMLRRDKARARIWSAFFADGSPAGFAAGAGYRSLFGDIYAADAKKSQTEGPGVSAEQLSVWIPEKDKRTKDKRIEELRAANLIKVSPKKGPDGEPLYILTPELSSHIELYCDYCLGKVSESDQRVLDLLLRS